MILRPRRSTLTHTLFPYTPLFRAPDPDLLDAPRAQRRLQGRARRRDSPHRLAPPGRGRLEAGDGPELPPRRSRRRPCADAGGRACRKDRADGGMKIGRASCRERVCLYVSVSVVAVSLKKKQYINTCIVANEQPYLDAK